jgi:hypothetical protein
MLPDLAISSRISEFAAWHFAAELPSSEFRRVPEPYLADRTEPPTRSESWRALGALPSAGDALRSLHRAVADGEIMLLDDTPRMRRCRGDLDPAVAAGTKTNVAPPSGYESDAWSENSGRPKPVLVLEGTWTEAGLQLGLTNRGIRGVMISPSILGMACARLVEVRVPPGAREPTLRFVDVQLGGPWSALPAKSLRKLFPGETHTWTVPLPAEVRGAHRVAVWFTSRLPPVVGDDDPPYLAWWSRVWVK